MQAKHAAITALWMAVAAPVWGVQVSTTALESSDNEQTSHLHDSEAKSSPAQPVTPLTEFPEKPPYDQALSELVQALDLFNSGHFEQASDMALEAYDDFSELGHIPNIKRSQIRDKKHQAAAVYVESSIEYIKKYLQRTENTPEVVEEARFRLEDLQDVARDYDELDKMLKTTLQTFPASANKQSKESE